MCVNRKKYASTYSQHSNNKNKTTHKFLEFRLSSSHPEHYEHIEKTLNSTSLQNILQLFSCKTVLPNEYKIVLYILKSELLIGCVEMVSSESRELYFASSSMNITQRS
uniref:Uncharacterized protein n=1 Tax=Cacopsylla melanoneura TaxID=428564 RepID=A0A8D9F7H2_9HEMI